MRQAGESFQGDFRERIEGLKRKRVVAPALDRIAKTAKTVA